MKSALDDNAKKLLKRRYTQEGEKNWNEVVHRVVNYVGTSEEKISVYKDKLLNLEFIPSSPCIINADANSGQLSSCFVIEVEDSIESIMKGLADCAKIFQMSGGSGFNISKLRPKGDPVKTAGGYSSGPISFLNLFDSLVNEVKQGNLRKGAIKADMNAHHPDIFEFVDCKNNKEKLNNMNISVSCGNEFMHAVKHDLSWDLHFEGKIYDTVMARDLWNKIVDSAHKTGEPGVSFRDNMEKDNMNPHMGTITGTNPCNEFTNIPYSSCNLGSINLEKVLHKREDGYVIDFHRLKNNTQIGTYFISDMIDNNNLPIPEIEEVTNDIRPAGLGVMGFANMLYKLGVPYGSEESIEITKSIFNNIQANALKANMELAEEKGVYPAWEGSKWEEEGIKVNLSSMLSIAPTGSISILAGTTGGIEPAFALAYTRRTDDGDTFYTFNEVFKNALKEREIEVTKGLAKKIEENGGSCQGINEIPQDIQEVFVTSRDISPDKHLEVLKTVNDYVDLSISKTINLPKTATKEEISDVYLEAWEAGIKGVTVYREGTRDGVLKTGKEDKKENDNDIVIPTKRPQKMQGTTEMHETGCGKLYLTINRDENGKAFETFITTGERGGCFSMTQGLSRMTSMALRAGIPVDVIADQLKSVRGCSSFSFHHGKGDNLNGKSCPDVIAEALKGNTDDFKLVKKSSTNEDEEIHSSYESQEAECPNPNCEETLTQKEGCMSCISCGFSMCN